MLPELRYENMTMNQLRELLYEAGIEYPDNATKQDLIDLIKEYKI